MKATAVALLLVLSLTSASQNRATEPCDQMIYEFRSQIEPQPIELGLIEGTVQDIDGVRIPKACIGVFSEPGHKLIKAVETDSRGRFTLSGVAAGNYRIVSSYPPLCPANTQIRLTGKRGNAAVIRMRAPHLHCGSSIETR